MKIDVCICTHNPRRDIFEIVLNSLVNQTLSKENYEVWIIDNNSNPPLRKSDFYLLEAGEVKVNLIQEKRTGLSYARWCAYEVTKSEIIVFVDDDNELTENYLEKAFNIFIDNNNLGCFGGKLLLPEYIKYPQWIKVILPYLGIKDLGEEIISNCANYWGEWEPAGAGVVIHRKVLDLYVERLKNIPQATELGHKGNNGLLSCDDSLMMRGAYELGFLCSYQPSLVLKHHINPKRFNFFYLVKLLNGYGRSYVILETILGNNLPNFNWHSSIKTVIKNCLYRIKIKETKSIFHLILMIAWDLGYFYQLKQKEVN